MPEEPPDQSGRPEPDEDGEESRRPAVIAGIVVILLVAAGVWLSGVLNQVGRIQDCVMSGRSNCVQFH
ncbi:MAG: hypothetical protein KGJ41_05665 [Rhodospirillales bacterium]|nr:hypothetical protein [Rhodospirillales bacterium]MDE2198493.1 hypothetical protein [Rhodospirillales bacterium]MDE2576104.1 hypothetical protein [Rhodospirillales bacterium]